MSKLREALRSGRLSLEALKVSPRADAERIVCAVVGKITDESVVVKVREGAHGLRLSVSLSGTGATALWVRREANREFKRKGWDVQYSGSGKGRPGMITVAWTVII